MAFHVVLVEPEIPPNTGNIARTCAATGTILHLIKPLGFSVDDKHVKRAGLDYWDKLELEVHANMDDFFHQYPNGNFYFLSTKAAKRYTDISFQDGDFLIFGKETKGLPETLLADHYDKCLRIPMNHNIRSLNLANSAAIVLYEALRQHNFSGMQEQGHLTVSKDQ